MKTPEQLKGAIRNIAAAEDLRSQEVLQMFMFERILDRLAASQYRNNFILKGGLLISSMIGISERTTMDMDTTVKGIDMTEEEIARIIRELSGRFSLWTSEMESLLYSRELLQSVKMMTITTSGYISKRNMVRSKIR